MFYLATDDMEEEKRLREAFPGRILSNENRCLRRDSVDGMHDALLDLYCLAPLEKSSEAFSVPSQILQRICTISRR